MIIIEKNKYGNGVCLKGDFFDLDRLYFAIFKFTGFHGIDDQCTFPGYEDVCENLLGLCYEIRHAWQGDRDIEEVYNGIQDSWFDNSKNDDDDPDSEDDFILKFPRNDFSNVTNRNTYFSIPLGFAEAVFYTLILLELLKKKDVFLLKRKQLAERIDHLTELNKQYYYFQANEDIARMTLFTYQTLHALYKFIGEEKYTAFMNQFNKYTDFFLKCDLSAVNAILAEYEEQVSEIEDPDFLFNTLIVLLE